MVHDQIRIFGVTVYFYFGINYDYASVFKYINTNLAFFFLVSVVLKHNQTLCGDFIETDLNFKA